jgi:hypothetical protein
MRPCVFEGYVIGNTYILAITDKDTIAPGLFVHPRPSAAKLFLCAISAVSPEEAPLERGENCPARSLFCPGFGLFWPSCVVEFAI